MANRAADTTLIRGAREAYRNLDNVPGIYAGLDKIGQAGIEMMEIARVKKEKAEAEKRDKIKRFDAVSADVLKRSGSFKSAKDRNLSFDIVSGIKKDYLAADNDKDKAGALIALQNEVDYINGLVDFKAKAVSSNISKAMHPREGGNTGKNLEIITSFQNEEYDVSIVNGERVFTGKLANGDTYSLTKAQLEDIVIFKNPAYANAYNKVFEQEHDAFRFSENNVRHKVSQSLPLQGEYNDLYAFVNDPIRDNQDFYQMLSEDTGLDREIKAGFKKNEYVDTNTDGVVDPTELAAFKLAVIDPNSPVWKGDKAKWEEYCRRIVIDKLTNGIMNENKKLYPERYKTEQKEKQEKQENANYPPAGATLTTLNGTELLVDGILPRAVDDITNVENVQDGQFYESGGKIYEANEKLELIELKITEPTAGGADNLT